MARHAPPGGTTLFDHALGYIDPGSGSLIIQVLIASILAVPYFLRTQIGRAFGVLRGRSKGKPAGEVPAETSRDEPT